MVETATAPALAAGAAPAADPKAALVTGAPAAKASVDGSQKFIVNGKEVELTPAQIKVAVQKGLFADSKLESMKVLQGKTAALLSALKTPDGLLTILRDPALGASPKEVFKKLMASDVVDDELKETMAKWVYDNVVVQSKKTPEQIEQEKRLAKLDKLEKEDAERKQKDLSAQQQAQLNQVYQEVRSIVTNEIVADKFFPKSEPAIRMVIDKLRVMNRKGAPINPENVKKAMGIVKSDFLSHQQAFLDADDDAEALISRIGEARALKISKALIARLQSKAKIKQGAEKTGEGAREKVTDRIDKKLGKTSSGHFIMDV